MKPPRRGARGLQALAAAASLGLAMVANLASVAHAQEEPAAPTATPPPAFEFDRAVGPLAFEVDFKLADKDDAHLQILFDEAEGEKSQQEREILSLDFQPFEGARFVLSRSTRSAPLVSSALAQVPEPKDLEFKLKVELPQEGGLAVTMKDGFPIVIATTPRAQRMKVQFAASGAVVAFTATKAERVTRLKLDAAGEAAMAKLVALAESEYVDPDNRIHGGLGPAIESEFTAVAPLKQVRAIDRQEAAGGILERLVVEFEEGIESPLIVARPANDAKIPALLVIAGEPDGIASPTVRAALARGIDGGRLVAAFELIGVGERRSSLPHDDLRVPELELVGISSLDLATKEALQLINWRFDRPDVDETSLAVAGTGAGSAVAEQVKSVEQKQSHSLTLEKLPSVDKADLPAEFVRVGEDYLHLRFDSCQLLRTLDRREELPAPDDSVPLIDRVRMRGFFAVAGAGLHTLVVRPGERPVQWHSSSKPPKFSKNVIIAVSDRGMRVALEEAAARLPARDDETLVALDPSQLQFVRPGPSETVDVVAFIRALTEARGPNAEPPRIFADGTTALPLLTTLFWLDSSASDIHVKSPIASFTAAHAIPSFDILLQRPFRAHRADPSLEVLTQGMPMWVFVPNALTRFEIEDVVLALTGRGLKIDWQDPVDALRRPLTRHDRLAMWPRVRHAEFVR